MSESNGYATFEEIERDHIETRYADVTVCGKKFQLRSWTAEESQRFLSESAKHSKTINQRLIIGVVEKPKMTRDHIERLCKIDAAFVGKLAEKCGEHVGIRALEEIEEEEKN